MGSLSSRLILAFLFVSVVGVVLATIFVGRRTQREFDQFVLERYQADLVEELSDFYSLTGGWNGINSIVLNDPGPRRISQGSELTLAPVTLTDAAGTVIFGGWDYRVGDQVPVFDLRRAVPVESRGQTTGWLLFNELADGSAAPAGSLEAEFISGVNQAILFGALGAVGVALIIGVLLARTISRPVRQVTEATQQLSSGQLGFQVPVNSGGELGELAASFNRMSADLEQSNRLRRQMTADIAHDLRTPLSVIMGYMESLSLGKMQPTSQTLGLMYAKTRHLQYLINDLHTLALADAGELPLNRRPVTPRLLLEHSALTHVMEAQEKGVAVTVDAQPALPEINVDTGRMSQVLGNLISNALRYTPRGGGIWLTAEKFNGSLLIRVRDNGPGIADDHLPYIFDRFYRADESRAQSRPNENESGLGLAIARSVVEAHGGTIAAASRNGDGALFAITLPLL